MVVYGRDAANKLTSLLAKPRSRASRAEQPACVEGKTRLCGVA